MLECVNSLLASGEVPGLFTPDELAKELLHLEPRAAEDAAWQAHLAALPSPLSGAAALQAYLLHRVRRNLHVVLCMDPAHELFRLRCESNPALLGACCVLWWPGWALATLQQLPASRLQVSPECLSRPPVCCAVMLAQHRRVPTYTCHAGGFCCLWCWLAGCPGHTYCSSLMASSSLRRDA